MKTETGSVGIPNSYFLKMAKHDYEDHERALPREFYQNSIDAKAKLIQVFTNRDKRVIIVKDDGSGMTLDILKNKLLVLGGSHKEEGSVGAFGKAKELLFFSWSSYRIETGNFIVDGEGAHYTITEVDEHFKGTTCYIYIQDGENFGNIANEFKRIAQKMQTRSKIHVDDQAVTCIKTRGRKVKHVPGIGTIYQTKNKNDIYMQVRINGIWMFSQYVGDDMGELIVELDGSSTDILTSNRDGFKWQVRNDMSKLLEDLTTNKASALRKARREVIATIKGTGKIQVGSSEMALAKAKVLAGNNLMAIIDEVFSSDEEISPVQKYRIDKVARTTGKSWDTIRSQIKFIGYEPDFNLNYEEGKDESVEKFMTTKKAKLLATMWTEIIKQVLMDNERYIEFSAGFCFDNEVEAKLHQSNNGEVIFYFNPNVIKISEHRFIIMEDLKDMAIHEIAHLTNGNHNNDFICMMAEIRKKVTRANQKPYSTIQRTRV